ncbi:MAG TPA: transglycosylase domain-containing protein, partial [Actinospica sp.]|nr:transglycosylase domain-containing protein [Actinospica sp.]
MGGYQYGRGDSTDDDPRSQGQGGGGRRGYGAPGGGGSPNAAGTPGGGGSRGYGSAGQGRQPAQPPSSPQQPPGGYGSGGGGGGGYDPYGGPSGRSGAGGGGRRGYGGGSRGRAAAEPIPGEVVPPGYSSSAQPAPPADGYGAEPGRTRVQDAAEAGAGAVPTPRRSRLEERRAARGGDPRNASQEHSEQYPESALNGRSTRNGAAARSRVAARARGNRPEGPVKKTGYHRYFDYPRTGKYGWRHWAPSIRQVSGCFLAGFFLLLGLVAFEYETVQIPDEHSTAFAQSSFYDYADASTSFDVDGTANRTIVQYADIPMMAQDAVISQEDKTFWTNPGVSYTGTLRALAVDLMGGNTQGGSTITQQYVKNAYLTQAQTTSRKIDEIFISLKLAKKFDKKTIMTDYMNTSPFGRNTSGIAAGVKSWFNISLAQMKAEPVALQASQSAFLSMMLNSPSTYSAGWDPSQSAATQQAAKTKALARWAATLANMHNYKYLSDKDYQAALADKPNPVSASSAAGVTIQDVQMKQAAMSWLSTYNAQHPKDGGPSPTDISDNGGYTVVTTFNQQYMNMAQQAVQEELLSSETKFDKSTLSPGLAAVDPTTGDLVAFYGGTTYENSATMQTVQGGSTFKAFTLATALTNNWSTKSYISGDPWPDKNNPDEVKEDTGDTSGGITNDGSHTKIGPVSLQYALDDSVNTAFVRIEEQQPGQYQAVENMAESFGLSANTPGWSDSSGGCDNVRFTLGVCAVDPARMADAYSVLPDNGTLHQLVEIKEIKKPDGSIWTPKDYSSQAVSSSVAATETDMMTGVIHSSDGTANHSYNSSSLRMTNIAGKTGTSTMDITPSTTTAMQQAGYNDDNGKYDTAGIWFDGFSSKLSISVGISRWATANITVNGKVEKQTVQLPVDNIANGGNDYGAMYPFGVWAKFMQLMQGTPYGGDNKFPAPVPNPNATVMNSPTPSNVATTPSTTPTTPTAPATTPSTAQTSPTSGTSASNTPTCSTGFLSTCAG